MTYYKGENGVLELLFFIKWAIEFWSERDLGSEPAQAFISESAAWNFHLRSSRAHYLGWNPELTPLGFLVILLIWNWWEEEVSLKYEGKITQDSHVWGLTSLIILTIYYSEIKFWCSRFELVTLFFPCWRNWL